jgi:uncharacterized protein with predicted RNA binding PUA domain
MEELRRLRGIADYQFGRGCGEALFSSNITVTYSKSTGRIRHVYLEGKRIATLRPNDGLFTLTIVGAELLLSKMEKLGFTVTVVDGVEEEIAEGKSVFAKHVLEAGSGIRPGDEVVVLSKKRKVLAVGRALLNGEEMLVFKTGVAVKVRRGRLKEEKGVESFG